MTEQAKETKTEETKTEEKNRCVICGAEDNGKKSTAPFYCAECIGLTYVTG